MHISKTIQWGGFLGRTLGQLIKIGLPLMKNQQMSSTKKVLIPFRLTAVTTAVEEVIHKKFLAQEPNTENFKWQGE